MDEQRRGVKRKCILAAVIVASKRFVETIIMNNNNSDSSSDSEDETQMLALIKRRVSRNNLSPKSSKITRIENYSEVVIPSYDDKTFQSHFRLTIPAYNKVLNLVEPILKTKYEYARPREQIEKKLLAVLWLLSTPESYRSVGDRFDLGKASLSDWFFRVIRALYELAPIIIKWPSSEERIIIKEKFKKFANFPNVIGAIDGTYIPIKKPKNHAEAYLTRKCCYAFTLQAISEPSLKFTDTFIGYPGSVNDCRIFSNSHIFKLIVANTEQYFEENTYTLGDKAYPLMNWCLTPYINRGNLTPSQVYFNEVHAKTRQVIERTFCLFFGRYRRFKLLDMTCTDVIPMTVVAACVLHNLCIDFDVDIEAYIGEGKAFLQEFILDGEEVEREENRNLASIKRDDICLNLFINRRR